MEKYPAFCGTSEKLMIENYNHKKIEQKWREIWEKSGIYNTDLSSKAPKFYNLIMFPYPSGEYLHIGHAYSDTGADVYGRHKKLNGFNVFMPIGYDSFGLPAENFAIKAGVNPIDSTSSNIEHAEKQLKSWGCSFDWSHKMTTSEPEYYKWTQWLFLKLYEKGLAYQKEAPVNWCPQCKTVLANEQVIDGLCERCDTEVVQKNLKQWFFKITDYADRLIKDLDKVDWPESSIVKQRNWIGRSEGVDFKHKVKDLNVEFEVYDSIPQTFMAQTFVVIAPEHPLVKELVQGTDQEKPVNDFVNKIIKKKAAKKFNFEEDMEGVCTGRYVENYLGTGKDIPIWVASFVVMDYGTGIVACSAHDERDFAFAKKYNIPLKAVLFPKDKKLAEKVKKLEVFYREPDGRLEEPEQFQGMRWDESRKTIIDYIEKNKLGKRAVHYRLRDWSIGRQRYWGDPIPIIYCDKCGVVPVPEKDLPVKLPEIKDFKPKGTGKGPLANVPEFVNTKCPKCGGKAERETDTMDTFVDSSFYFMRYPNVDNDKEMMNSEVTRKWLPVDIYVGGAEHVTMHCLYARFITKALYDMKMIHFDEPFEKLRHQGMILGPDGKKMSKSKGNVIIPDAVIREHGADAFRTYILFMGRFEDGGPWNPKGLIGVKRFLEKIWKIQESNRPKVSDIEVQAKLARTIKKVGEDIVEFKFNTAIASLMKLSNILQETESQLSKEDFEKLLIILSLFAPFMTEELWEKLGNKESIHVQGWPEYDEKLIKEETVTIAVQMNGKVREQVVANVEATQDEVLELAKASEKVQKYLEGKELKKVIYIPGKLLSLVIS